MTAEPLAKRLEEDDPDLLISRSLDGDLTEEEERRLDELCASNPVVARRREDLSRVVEDLRAVPVVEPPFALATRVNARVAERGGAMGTLWGRFGLYPPPASVLGGVGVLAFVVVMGVLFRKAPVLNTQLAGNSRAVPAEASGPVRVFFEDKKESVAAAERRQAESKLQAEEADRSASGRAKANAVVATNDAKKAADAPAVLQEPVARMADASRVAESQPPAERSRTLAAARDEAPARADADELAAAKPAAPAAPAATGMMAAAPAPAPPAARREAQSKDLAVEQKRFAPEPGAAAGAAGAPLAKSKAEAAPGWSVRLEGEGSLAWRPVKTPISIAGERNTIVTWRLGLDAAGRVRTLELLAPRGLVRPDLEAMVRGFVFERTSGDGAGQIELVLSAR